MSCRKVSWSGKNGAAGMDNTLNFAGLTALGMAFCWRLRPLILPHLSVRIGAFGFVRWRMWTSFILMSVIITLGKGWQGYGRDDLVWLVLSGSGWACWLHWRRLNAGGNALASKLAVVNGGKAGAGQFDGGSGDQTWLCGAVPFAVPARLANDDKMSREVEPARSGWGLSQFFMFALANGESVLSWPIMTLPML